MSRKPDPGNAVRDPLRTPPPADQAGRGRRSPLAVLALVAAVGLLSSGASFVAQDGASPGGGAQPPSLDELRITMDKWLQTQQIIGKESREWQQGREILTARLQLVQTEIATLRQTIDQAKGGVAEANRKRDELLAENEKLKATGAQLVAGAAAMEGDVRKLFATLPEPVRVRLQPLAQRLPEDSGRTTVSAAERYQNVLGILNEVAKANSEISVVYEVRNLEGGRAAEVQAMYAGLAQAWYVSASGEAGIGRPGPDGWTWEPRNAIAGAVLLAIDIVQGKHSPAFVPLPVTIQ